MKKFSSILIFCLVVPAFLAGCSKQFSYDHAVLEINGHFVYFDNAGIDWLGNTEDAKVLRLGNNTIVGTSAVLYEQEPDASCYEYTAEEFAKHECSADADWRCPHYGHEPVAD